MAVTYIDHAGTQGQTDFSFNFPYLEDEHIKVEIAGVDTTAFTVVATPTSKIVLDAPGLSAAASVRVRRRSAPNENLVDFVNGSVLTESELDLSYRHNRYLAEEIAELNDASLQIENGGTEWDAKTKRIKNVGTAVDSTDAVTKVYLDNKVAQVSTGATHPPLKWVFSAISGTNNTYTVTGAEVLGDTAYEVSIDGLIKEPTVEYTVDPSTDTLTIIPNMTSGEDIVVIQRGFGVAIAGTVDTNSLEDGSVTNPKLAAGAVTSDKTSFTDLTVSSPLTVTSTGGLGGYGGIEVGGPNGGYIDFKSPASDDYDGRVIVETSTLDILGKQGVLIYSGPVIAIKVSSDGKVRIGGADNPTHDLDVTGDLNITGDYKVNGTNALTVPTGTVSAFAGSAAPTGYALCDGSAVNTHAQSALHAVVSDTYGGDAYVAGVTDQPGVTTTFNLPDLRGRVVAGLGGSLLNSTDTLSDTGGTKTVSHTHNLTTTNIVARHPADQAGVICLKPPASVNSSTINNVQPTIILNYIIKT
jgi:microcystin-dependent protein